MEIVFSKHSLEKLEDSTSQKLDINRDTVENVLQNPEITDSCDYPLMMAIKEFKENLSLCVIYKFVNGKLKVITFFPSRRGRYENKIF
ncbi:MAG: hypothetical protein KKC11_08575 [Candidatus Omnitrophica bacterium]|nr:hypothetical protein [Candidatus Omnitrophota bacterium]MBU2437323.1 hypothetical protein [Candidatus Omnitrophota bacterium]